MRNLSDLYVFPNKLVVLALTGAEIVDWLEQSAALFCQITPGETDVDLHDIAVPSFTFDVIPGLSYAIDLSQPARFDPDGRLINPAARRIVGPCLDEQPLDPAQRLLLVTNNHRASRASASGAGPTLEMVLSDGARTQSLLADYIRGEGIVGAPPRRSWHFLPMPGTSVRMSAGFGSCSHMADIAALRPERLGEDAEGFSHYRLHL